MTSDWDPIDEGGDAACWAHLFEDAPSADLVAVSATTAVRGPAWTLGGRDLDANLIVLDAGSGIAAHTNREVDVLLVGVAGRGQVIIDGVGSELRAGRAVLVPRGSERQVVAETDRFAYLTVHRARPPLLPSRRGGWK